MPLRRRVRRFTRTVLLSSEKPGLEELSCSEVSVQEILVRKMQLKKRLKLEKGNLIS